MKSLIKSIFLVSFLFLLVPFFALAHQPRIVTEKEIIVTEPEVSKAYYGQLNGDAHIYKINAKEPFQLYVNLLVPNVKNQKKDIAAVITKNGNAQNPVAMLIGANYDWKNYFEEFGRSNYWKGPEFKKEVGAGEYEIKIWNGPNDSKYVLAIGEKENFNFAETRSALSIIPSLKWNFFNQLPLNFILSPFGFSFVFVSILIAFAISFLIYLIKNKHHAKNPHKEWVKHLNPKQRKLRLIIGLILLLLNMCTAWSFWGFIISGFFIFEVVFNLSIYNVFRLLDRMQR